MNLTLYTTTDDNNKVNKSLSTNATLTGTLRNNCSVIKPVVIVESSTFISSNYAYIQQFGRYYFIDNITVIKNNVYQLEMSVDVLMTYKEQFLPLKALISRQEEDYNLDLIDNKMTSLLVNNTDTMKFPNGFDGTPHYVLSTVGCGNVS